MPGYNGAGIWDIRYNFVTDATNGVKILASRQDQMWSDVKQSFQNCLTADGQVAATASVNLGNQKIINLANGAAATDAAAFGQISGITTGSVFRKNLLCNGAFDVWQSGAGGTAVIGVGGSRTRTADTWWAFRSSGAVTVSQVAGVVARYAAKVQRNNADVSVVALQFAQQLETADTIRLTRGSIKPLMFSCYMKAGANYSGGAVTIDIVKGTGTDESVLAGFTGASVLATVGATISGSMTRFTLAVTPDAATTQLGVRFTWTPTGTAGADDSVTFECCQLEVSPIATDYEFLPLSDVLRRCLGYFQKSASYAVAPGTGQGSGTDFEAQAALGAVANACTMWIPFMMPAQAVLAGRTQVFYNPFAANSNPRNLTKANDGSIGTSVSGTVGLQIQITGSAGATAGDLYALAYVTGNNNF